MRTIRVGSWVLDSRLWMSPTGNSRRSRSHTDLVPVLDLVLVLDPVLDMVLLLVPVLDMVLVLHPVLVLL